MGWQDRFKRKTKTEDVLIVVLAGNGTVHASLLQMARDLDSFSALKTHRFMIDLVTLTASPQEKSRNIACGLALKTLKRPNDTLLMIDNDMIQYGWRSLRILDTPDYDIAGALQYMWLPRDVEEKKEPRAFPCAFNRKPEGQQGQIAVYPQPGNGKYAEVDRVGSGFMAIKRRVLADPRMHLAPDLDPPALWRNVFAPNYERIKGLDMDFCDRAKEHGYRVVVNWDAEVGHAKTVNVNEVDQYAKTQFVIGYQIGERSHALQVEGSASGSIQGTDRGLGSHGNGDEGVGAAVLDRASLTAEA